MNIPDDAFYGLVTQGMRQRTDETLQLPFTTLCAMPSCREPWRPAAVCQDRA